MDNRDFSGKDVVLNILKKGPTGISEAAKDILRSRKGYLTTAEREQFGLDEEPAPKKKKKEDE